MKHAPFRWRIAPLKQHHTDKPYYLVTLLMVQTFGGHLSKRMHGFPKDDINSIKLGAKAGFAREKIKTWAGKVLLMDEILHHLLYMIS